MKKRIFTLLLALVAVAATAGAQVAINATNFPDANFRAFVAGKAIDKDANGYLSTEEIAAVVSMNVASINSGNLKGIEHFTALTSLECYDNQLTVLDVSKNTKLTVLVCSYNQLIALDVSKNTALELLYCFGNKIKGDKMLALVNSLPKVTSGKFYAIDTKDSNEQNVITKSQVNIAKGKGWTVVDYHGGSPQVYAGSDEGIAINATNFPDENFRNWLLERDYGKDKMLTTEEIANVTEIKVISKGIKNLKGIEHFTALQKLNCNGNQLTALDVSKNTALRILNCSINQLTALDVSKNIALEGLGCFDNQLTTLDVSENTALEILYCSDNQLTVLDVSKNTALTELDCMWNQLTVLDVSKNTKLTELNCFGNKIKGDKMQALVNSLPKVTSGTFCVIDTKDSNEQNVITKSQVKIATDKGWKVYDYNGGSRQEYAGSDEGIAINATNFPDANFRAVVAGKTIDKDADGYLSTGEIAAVTVMDVKKSNIANLKGIEHFTALRMLDCCKNQLTSLDVSKNTALTALECYDNQLTSLDVSKNTKLTYLDCSINQIKGEKMLALVNSLPKVTKGDFGVIDTKNSKEQNVCTKSQVNIAKGKGWTVVDYHGGSEQVYAGSDDPTGIAINATNFPDENFRNWLLEQSYGEDKILTAKEIAAVTEMNVSSKQIANLKGIEHFTALTYLDCGANQLTSLDVSKNTKLEYLFCYSNKLTALDVSKNTALGRLECGNNQLTKLDVSKNTEMYWLACYNNQLTALDVSKNTELVQLYCYSNKIKGEKMLALVNSLPKVSIGFFFVFDTKKNTEQNVITKSQVAIAKGKGWKVVDPHGNDYAGSDDTTTGLTAVESGQLTVDSWYSIDGKKLAGEPTKKGVYIIKGKKVKK